MVNITLFIPFDYTPNETGILPQFKYCFWENITDDNIKQMYNNSQWKIYRTIMNAYKNKYNFDDLKVILFAIVKFDYEYYEFTIEHDIYIYQSFNELFILLSNEIYNICIEQENIQLTEKNIISQYKFYSCLELC